MKIAMIDDHRLFLSGISALMTDHFQADVQEFASAVDFLEQVDRQFDLLVTDLEMGQVSGLDLIQQLKNEGFNKPVVVVSMHNKLAVIRKCKEMGVNGYLLKDEAPDVFVSAVGRILEGETVFSTAAEATLENVREYGSTLSPREEEILICLAKGMDNQTTADHLFISLNTVKTHRRNLKSKLGLDSTAEIVKYAIDNLLMDQTEKA